MDNKTKLLKPKVDVVFQALFGEEGSEKITKAFLEKILEIPIVTIELNQNPILRRENLDDKLGVLDVLVKINEKENCDIEMQMVKEEDIKDRILFYWSKLYLRSIKRGQDYDILEKSIVILITDKKLEGLEELSCHTEWKIIETKTNKKILTNKLEIHIIELEKLKENMEANMEGISEELLDWLIFLENPESERLLKKMGQNEALKEAKEKLEKISEDGKMQQLAWWREKGVYEENSRRNLEKRIKEGQAFIEREGKKIEERQKKLEEGQKELEEGQKELEEGQKELEEGQKELEEGKKKLEERKKKLEERKKELEEGQKELEEQEIKIQKEQILKIAEEMLIKKVPLEFISEITKLSIEEIKKINY